MGIVNISTKTDAIVALVAEKDRLNRDSDQINAEVKQIWDRFQKELESCSKKHKEVLLKIGAVEQSIESILNDKQNG